MKKTIIITLFLFLSFLIGTSFAVEVTLFGPNQYVRTTGPANVYTDTFSAIPGEARLIVKNGDWDDSQRVTDAISSASVVVNGEQIFGPDDFNQQVHILETSVNLAEDNSITVELASNPGSYLTIEVTQDIDPPTVIISAVPDSIVVGESATLTWTSNNAESATIDQGIGDVDVSGSTTVSPTETTSYTITVTGLSGTATDQALVTVTGGVEPQPEGSFGEQYEDLIPPDATLESYDPKRFSVITGLVHDLAGSPISDISLTIHVHPEYGTAETNAEGRFSIPVEGGGIITIVYQKDSLITAQRQIYVPWNDIAIAETIVMITEDPASTTLTFDGNPDTVVTHQSTEVTDESGSRSCTTVFTGDNRAYLVDEEENDVQELTTITTRATEFTTPESMPAILPSNVAYTYCAELSVDGAQRVRFDKPVITWVDNFLGFNVGEIVPVGYYDRDRGVWVPSENGVVVKLLNTDTDGIVDALDADGDDLPDDLNNSGSFSDEVMGLDDPERYAPGSTFWRVSVTHFSPWDCNWPYGPPDDATPPNPEGEPDVDQQQDEDKSCKSYTSSFVEDRSRIFHEDIPIPGTNMILHYTSNRVEGYKSGIITVPASGETIPESLKRIIVKIEVAGRTMEQDLDPLPNQKAEFIWDGLDYLGRPVDGTTTAHIIMGFVYDAVYYIPADFQQAFGQAGDEATSVRARQEVTSWKHSEVVIDSKGKGKGVLAEGWTLSSHHHLDPKDPSRLYKGDGTVSTNNAIIIDTVAGTGTRGYSGDGGPAAEAWLAWPSGVAVDAAGNIFIADSFNHRIRKVDASGIITTVAGTETGGYSGDGGPATEAQLRYPNGVAVDAAGSIFIADYGNDRIRKVDASGIITTVAGIGAYGYSGDGGPAAEAQLNCPNGVAVDAAGSIFIADSNNCRIRNLGPPSTFANTMTAGDIPFAEKNGLGHIMSSAGLHKSAIDLDTGITLYEFGYDQDDNLVSITDQFGSQTTIVRDGGGVPTAITSPDGITTTLTIDADNHLTRIAYPDGSNYSFEYTADGMMTAEIEPEGNRFEHDFGTNGRVTDVFDEQGGHWNYARTAYKNGDILTEVTTGEGNLTSYLDHTYSTGEYTSTITDPTGAEILYTQSADGLSVNKSLSCGMEIGFKYDVDPEYKFKYVKEMSESTPSTLKKVTLREKIYQDTNSNDASDLISETVTVNGNTTTLENNTLQSQKTIASPEGRTVTTHYDSSNLLTTSLTIAGFYDTNYGYDIRGRLTSIGTSTRETSFAYDAQGFLSSITDPENHTTTYTYDPVGRMIGISRPDGSAVDFTYDQNGNMTVLTNPSAINHGFGYNKVNLNSSYLTPISGSYSYVYDKDRRLIQTNFPSGKQINNVYDKTRLTQIQTPEGNIDLTYLCSTKVGSITNGTDTISYEYDGKLVTSENLSGTLNESLGYTYNNDFNVSSFSYAGKTHIYTYDNDGLLSGAGNFTIFRNAQNGLPETVTGADLNLTRTFNGYGEVQEQDLAVSSQVLNTWSLTRDNTGRITAKTETVDSVTSNYAYSYDPMGRLLTVTKDGVLVEEYDYSANGTRTYEMNTLRGIAGRAFAYSDEDHLLTAGDATYQYDVDGFLTTRTQGVDITTYDYSIRGELLNVTLPDGTSIEYINDPLGRRIAKKVNGAVVEKYLWQGLTRLLAVYDGTDNLLMRFEYADGRMPVVMTKDGVTYYLTCDQVGSLRIVADTAGNVLKRIEYDSFGNIIQDTNPSFAIPFGFAGGLHDHRDTGLVRFGYRDYDPDTARWTAKDPIGFAGGDTNLYGYCLNDPVNLVDPYGLINWSAVGNGAMSAFGGGVAVVGGTTILTTGVGAVGGVSAILVGSAAFGWGVSQMITGFLDNEIPFMGVKEAVIKNTTACDSTQDELVAINTLGDMLLTGRTVPSNIGNINSVIQSSQSIYSSGSTIMNAIK
jgi:RHS repeat-associated protein